MKNNRYTTIFFIVAVHIALIGCGGARMTYTPTEASAVNVQRIAQESADEAAYGTTPADNDDTVAWQSARSEAHIAIRDTQTWESAYDRAWTAAHEAVARRLKYM